MGEEATTQWQSLKERKGNSGNVMLKSRIAKLNLEKRSVVRLQEHICIWTQFTQAEESSQRKIENSLMHGIKVILLMSGNAREQRGSREYKGTGMRLFSGDVE